jgi:hypothetical protein
MTLCELIDLQNKYNGSLGNKIYVDIARLKTGANFTQVYRKEKDVLRSITLGSIVAGNIQNGVTINDEVTLPDGFMKETFEVFISNLKLASI